MFGAATSGNPSGGPCLYEPAGGALFPNNWLRPRFMWTAASGLNLFEIRLHSPKEANDLVVYTTQTKWTMPKMPNIWANLSQNLPGEPITVTIRGMSSSGGTPSLGTSGTITIAPAPADGAMVFWSTKSFQVNATTTDLQGFQVGDESTITALTPSQVQQTVWAGPPDGGNFPSPPVREPVGCIGCHTSTPDGNYVGFTAQWPWPNAIASVQADAGTLGAAPPWLAQGAIDNLGPNTNDANYLGGTHVSPTNNVDNVMLGIQTFSKAHYQNGDRIEVTSVGAAKDQPENSAGMLEQVQPSGVVSQLIWVDLEWNGNADAGRPTAAPGAMSNGGWGTLSRGGDDTNSAGAPNWSHDGMSIAYTSVNGGTMDGRLEQPTSGSADVKIIPYGAKAGGPASPLQGASDPSLNEYFPAFSPDDKFIAFNRVPAADSMYNQPAAEVFVVPAGGATQPVRMAANDPVTCTGLTSPGVQNTWPKWAPGPVTPAPDGKVYYWVTFSSIRINDVNNPASGGGSPKVQLYVAGVVVDTRNNNKITTYPGIYLWNQDPTVNNLIPAWDNFAIPPAIGGPPR
jgi:hypothetical protein